MFTPLRRRTMMFCPLALTSLTSMSIAQNQLCTGTTPCVTTWHDDSYRTGWQQNETTLTPQNVTATGNWSSPAFWNSGTNAWLYYAATSQNEGTAPYPINGYMMAQTSPTPTPIPQTPNASTTAAGLPALFCYPSPTPSVSSNGAVATTGIVWAIEHQYGSNPTDCSIGTERPHAALHAFNATTLVQLYSSKGVATGIGNPSRFSTPTIFMGQVYMGTWTEVDVFGLCSSNVNSAGQCLN
jgi:hypothetical protein